MVTVLDSVVVPRSSFLHSSTALSRIAAPLSLYSLSADARFPHYRGLKVGSALRTRSVESLSYSPASERASCRGELIVCKAQDTAVEDSMRNDVGCLMSLHMLMWMLFRF